MIEAKGRKYLEQDLHLAWMHRHSGSGAFRAHSAWPAYPVQLGSIQATAAVDDLSHQPHFQGTFMCWRPPDLQTR